MAFKKNENHFNDPFIRPQRTHKTKVVEKVEQLFPKQICIWLSLNILTFYRILIYLHLCYAFKAENLWSCKLMSFKKFKHEMAIKHFLRRIKNYIHFPVSICQMFLFFNHFWDHGPHWTEEIWMYTANQFPFSFWAKRKL